MDWGWIFGLGSLALAAAGWLCAWMIHLQDERHLRECGILLDYALDADDRMWAVQDIADAWVATAIQGTKDYNTAQEHILALELQLAEEKSKHAGKSEHDTVELPEQEYEVLPQAEKPKRARAKRTGQEQA